MRDPVTAILCGVARITTNSANYFGIEFRLCFCLGVLLFGLLMRLGVVVARCFVSQSFLALSAFVSVDCAVSTVLIKFFLGYRSLSLISFWDDWFAWGFLRLDRLIEWLEELLVR